MIELRSDTFTKPTKKMIEAISVTELGDDVYGEDNTVNRLETLSAEMLGKEAGCFMPSGTMANLASIMAHCPRGSKVLVGDESDIYIYEAGGAAVCGGIMYESIPTQVDGRLLIDDLEKSLLIDKNDPQFALPALICLENTHNRCGGIVLPLEYLKQVSELANKYKVPIHMDGARLFNASTYLGVKPSEIVKYADSVQFCLSKGLSAPIGSMVVGSKSFINKVRRIRKMLGGGMRQVGVVAAAGIVSLNEMVDRIKEDHDNTLILAKGLADIPGVEVNIDNVQTNIVFFTINDERYTWQEFIERAQDLGLNIAELGYGRIRAVTHYGINKEDIYKALDIISNILK
ncbi:MAG: low-specificity L-threonine aldolase [Firmicutes bacterium]|nr:low-specificity L-threonine aldolase [Bacillota bacterium]